MLQAFDFPGLFQEHGQEDGFEGQGVVGLADGGDVLAGVGEEGVEKLLVFAPQGSPEITEGLLFAENYLVGCLEGSSHGLILCV
jgi:hypothetical protein